MFGFDCATGIWVKHKLLWIAPLHEIMWLLFYFLTQGSCWLKTGFILTSAVWLHAVNLSFNYVQLWPSGGFTRRSDGSPGLRGRQSVAMKIHQQTLYILWSVLSLGFLSCAADTHETFTRRKTGFKLSAPKSKLVKLSSRGHSSPSSTSPLSPLRSWGVHSFPPPPTPRSLRPGKAKANTRSHFAHLPDVSVTCSVSDFVVRVKPAFYGLGADAEELKLGSDCKSNGVLRPYGDLLFTYPLTACDAVREVRRARVFSFEEDGNPASLISKSQYVTSPVSCPPATWSTNWCSITGPRTNGSQAERAVWMSTLNAVLKGLIGLSYLQHLVCEGQSLTTPKTCPGTITCTNSLWNPPGKLLICVNCWKGVPVSSRST